MALPAHKDEDKYMSELHEFDKRINRLEIVIENINDNLRDIKQRLTNIEIDSKEMRKEFHSEIKELRNWMIGGFSGVLALLAHSLHWI